MSKKQKAFLKEENLLTLISQNNFIIPEIQREYVWGNNEKVITKFLKELKSKIGDSCECCHLPTENTRINIGFLYSYKPDYVKVQNNRFLDENLIDGQQRFTTLFLLAFYFALKEDKKGDFLSLIRFDDISMSFDFKVRDLTKRFLLEFVEKTNTIEELKYIKKQTWFLKDYKTDVSINSMINSLKYIQQVYDCNTKYYNHVLSNIVFWHFKTEVTSEGEELYITMNARGEDLADNEITKAALMLDGIDLFSSGRKWESWQHFFWKHRDKKRAVQSADYGYNSFISCIAGLENYLKCHDTVFKVDEVDDLLSIELIEKYINAFKFIIDNSEDFKTQYSYANWVDRCILEIWEVFNNNETDWFVDFNDQNKGTEQNRMIFIWSWFLYIKEKQFNEIDVNEFFRMLRFFYMRYKNNSRAVSSLKITVHLILTNKVFDTIDQEINSFDGIEESKVRSNYRTTNEILKYRFLSKIQYENQVELKKIESLIWEIEDHPLNIVGADLGNVNSSHLVHFNDGTTLSELLLIKEKLYSLFPIKEDGKVNYENAKKIRTILLFYGKYWKKSWASYYWRYDFGDWKRIIRDLDSDNTTFNNFFLKYKSSLSLDALLNEILIPFEKNDDSEDVLEVFKWYGTILKEKMWSQGQYISNNHYNYTNQDAIFPKFREFVNNKGNFNGGDPQILSELVKK